MIYVSYENRPRESVGLRLLALSLRDHAPGSTLLVPDAGLPAGTRDWLARADNVRLLAVPEPLLDGWAVKADALAAAVRHAGTRVTWLDADLLLTAPPARLDRLDQELLVAEEHWISASFPVQDYLATWNLELGRALTHRVNSCVVSATAGHLGLLAAWRQLLRSPVYQEQQKKPFGDRSPGTLSDQEVLCSLLCSTRFGRTQLAWLRSGSEIAHCMGYAGWSASERVRMLGRLPGFVHAMGLKPWVEPRPLFLELSPYLAVARRYGAELGDQAGLLDVPQSKTAKVFGSLSLGSAALRGLLPAIASELQWRWKLARHGG